MIELTPEEQERRDHNKRVFAAQALALADLSRALTEAGVPEAAHASILAAQTLAVSMPRPLTLTELQAVTEACLHGASE